MKSIILKSLILSLALTLAVPIQANNDSFNYYFPRIVVGLYVTLAVIVGYFLYKGPANSQRSMPKEENYFFIVSCLSKRPLGCWLYKKYSFQEIKEKLAQHVDKQNTDFSLYSFKEFHGVQQKTTYAQLSEITTIEKLEKNGAFVLITQEEKRRLSPWEALKQLPK